MHKSSGFSLLELLIYIILISSSILYFISFGNFTNQFMAKSDLDSLFAACHAVSKKSILDKKIYTISLLQDGFTDSFFGKNLYLSQNNQLDTILNNNILGPPSNPVAKITSTVSFNNNKIIFYPSGHCSAGTVYISSKNSVYALSSSVSTNFKLRRYIYQNGWNLLS